MRTALALLLAALAVGGAPAVAHADDPCPGQFSTDEEAVLTDQERADARNWDFSLVGRPPVHLEPPIKWGQDPYGSEAWTKKLNALVPVNILLVMYSRYDETGALPMARDMALDWIKQNPAYKGFGWQDKITGARAGRLGYLIAAGQCDGSVTGDALSKLRGSAVDHGKWLRDPDNYRPGNHGQFDMIGLLKLAGYLPSLPDASDWSSYAAKRFRDGLPIEPTEFVGLEHSPGYHFTNINQVEEVLDLPGPDDPTLVEADQKMREAASWFVMPDDTVTRLGDTGYGIPGQWAIDRSHEHEGIAPMFKTGYGIVSVPSAHAYLSVPDQLHPYGHRQADELTFELYDKGRHIVTDTGRYGALRDEDDTDKVDQLEFTKSTRAHSVLVVDGKEWPIDNAKPFGSGLEAGGSGDGWWALEGTNPLVKKQGVSHERLFVYKPGEALIVVDRVKAKKKHTYTRYFQFDPDISVDEGSDDNTFDLSASGFDGTLFNSPPPGDQGTKVVVGQEDPLLGFVTPADKFADLIPRAAVVQRSKAKSANYVSVISLDGGATAELSQAGDDVTVRLTRDGHDPTDVTVHRNGDTLDVSESPAG